MKKLSILLLCSILSFGYGFAQQDCQQEFTGSGSHNLALLGANAGDNIAAIDINVGADSSFTLTGIEIKAATDGFSFNLDAKIYEGSLENDNVIAQPELNILGMGMVTQGIFQLTYDIPDSVVLEGGSSGQQYWIALTASSDQTQEISWLAFDYEDTGNDNDPLKYSTDGGQTWSSSISGVSNPTEGIITVSGICEAVEGNEGGNPDESEITDCDQSFSGSGVHNIPLLGADAGDNIAAIDINVAADSSFTLTGIEIKAATDGFLFSLDATIYEGSLENNDIIAQPELNILGMGMVTQGIFQLTYDIPDSIVLEGGSSGQQYWIALTASANQTQEISWLAFDYEDTGNGNDPLKYSTDGGQTWSSSISGVTGSTEGTITVLGFCQKSEGMGSGGNDESGCSQGVASNDFESGKSINGDWSAAVDIVVPPREDFKLGQMKVNLSTIAGTEITSVDVYYYTDNNGLPGNLIGSQLNVVPSNVESLGQSSTGATDLKQATLALDSVLFEGSLAGPKHYWVRLQAENSASSSVWWETNSQETQGYKMASLDNGEWSIIYAAEGVYDFYGHCIPWNVTTDCGTTFTDENGANADYANSAQQVYHIIPELGSMASVEFTAFATEEGLDGLMVYDGPDTSSPIISSGSQFDNESCPNGAWTGGGEYSAEGMTFISSDPSGILTFVFTSDDAGTQDGWEANVTCVPPGSAGNCLPGQLETSFAANSSGLGGMMFDVSNLSDEALEIRKFGIHMKQGIRTVQVYYRPGIYEGHVDNPDGWTLLGEQENTLGLGQGGPTLLKVGGLTIPAGETYALYITIKNYQLTGPTSGVTFPNNTHDSTDYSNEDLKIEAGLQMASVFNTPPIPAIRSWQGIIYYCKGGDNQNQDQETPCLNAEYGQFPDYVYNTGCYGYPEAITDMGWRGEYSLVRVEAGTEYTFSSSMDTDAITISDSLGVTSLASGVGSVTWTSDFDGVVRFYTHTDDQCGTNISTLITRYVQCGEIYTPQPPDFDCYFGDGLASDMSGGVYIQLNGGTLAADDFIITGESFTAKQIRINVISDEPVTNGRFTIYENHTYPNGNGPEQTPFATTDLITPSNQIAFGNHGENGVYYELTFDLPHDITLPTGHYWLVPEINGVNTFWETTYNGSTGEDLLFNQGPGWLAMSGRNGVFFISGECSDMGVPKNALTSIKIYPNPVSQRLQIDADQPLSKVRIYNLLGVTVLSVKNPDRNSIDVSNFTSGLYFVAITTDNGAHTTLKIIKD